MTIPTTTPTENPIHAIATSAVCISIFLSGCVTTQPVTIRVPVSTPCLTQDQLPAQPAAKSDAELSKMSDSDLILNISADRLEYRRYHGEASALLLACAAIPEKSTSESR